MSKEVEGRQAMLKIVKRQNGVLTIKSLSKNRVREIKLNIEKMDKESIGLDNPSLFIEGKRCHIRGLINPSSTNFSNRSSQKRLMAC
jgi:hypothetical protein